MARTGSIDLTEPLVTQHLCPTIPKNTADR